MEAVLFVRVLLAEVFEVLVHAAGSGDIFLLGAPLPQTAQDQHFTSAQQHICYSALYAIARPSVRQSVCLSHGWISLRCLKLGSRNLHHRVAP